MTFRQPALALLMLVAGCHRHHSLTVAPARPIAERIAFAPADLYRPLDARAAAGQRVREEIPLSVVGDDARAVAAAALLDGELHRAEQLLSRAPPGDDVENDRAVVSLLSGDVAGALVRLDRLRAHSPHHRQAIWNRALALTALDLPLSAAQAFDDVRDGGWSAEARARSAALRATWQDRRAIATRAIAVGKAMIAGGPLPDAELVRRFPSFMRHYLYHSVRSAPSVERIEALRPLARALDGGADGPLGRWMSTVAAQPGEARATLGPRYGAAVIANNWPPAEQDSLLAALRHAHADDMLIGALVLFNRTGEADRTELRMLVERNGDPWWRLAAAGIEAQSLAARGEFATAAARLEAAIADARDPQLAYRRAMLEQLAATYEKEQHRTTEARRWALAAIADIHDSGLDPRFLETSTVFLLGEIAHLRDDHALMRAYLGEGLLRVPDLCAPSRYAHLMFGVEELSRLAFDEAADELARLPRCNGEYPLLAADFITSVARGVGPKPLAATAAAQVATLSADLAAARPSLTPSQRLLSDVIEARLVISHDRARAESMMAPALERPRRSSDDADAKKARAFAYQLVAIEAGRRGDWPAAIDALAREAGSAAGGRCALGVAVDDARVVVAMRDGDGRASGRFWPTRDKPQIDSATLVPQPIVAALMGCPTVSVYAQPPVHGRAQLLPPTIAWSYHVGRPTPPATAVASRRLVISDVLAPRRLGLPPLSPWTDGATAPVPTVHLRGADATPTRALAEMAEATEIEIHAHGLIDLGRSDTWLIALSEDGAGKFALQAEDIERQRFAGRPVVVLAACEAGSTAPYLHEPWSLPTALLDAGARAVVAPVGVIPDAEAGPFFEALLARVRNGDSVAVALRDQRRAWLDKGSGDGFRNWLANLVVFE